MYFKASYLLYSALCIIQEINGADRNSKYNYYIPHIYIYIVFLIYSFFCFFSLCCFAAY